MAAIVIVSAAFRLNVSKAKTEIICLRNKGMPESTAIFSVETTSQVYNQTNEFVYFGGNVGAASGSTPSNCTTDQALPPSSKYGC